LKLADLDAAFDALDLLALAVVERDPAISPPPLPRSPLALPPGAFVTAADSFLNDQSEPASPIDRRLPATDPRSAC